MRVSTFQPIEVWEAIKRDGVFVCDPRQTVQGDTYDDHDGPVINYMGLAYDWLVERMQEMIPDSPKDGRGPIWAWYNYDGDIYSWGEVGKRYALITLEIPDEQVVLSDISKWEVMMLGGAVCDEDEWGYYEDMEYDDPRVCATWTKCFRKPGVYPPDNWIQATFWEIRKEYVVSAEEFISIPYPDDEEDDEYENEEVS